MEIVRIENVVKSYGEGNSRVDALKGINLSIQQGEFVSIVGASGSGKSTLLHILGGLDRPSSGQVFIERTIFIIIQIMNFRYLEEEKLVLYFSSLI